MDHSGDGDFFYFLFCEMIECRDDSSCADHGYNSADSDSYRAAGIDDHMVITGEARPADQRAAGTPGQEHLSSLRGDYLQLLATETGARYARLVAPPDLASAIAALPDSGLRQALPGWHAALAAAALAFFLVGLVSGWFPRPSRMSRPNPPSCPSHQADGRSRLPAAGRTHGSRQSAAPDRKGAAGARV